MKTAGKISQAEILFSLIAIIAVAIPPRSSNSSENEFLARNANPFGNVPVFLLPDDGAIEVFHAMGYARSVETQGQPGELLNGLLGQGNTPIVAYLASQVLHNAALIYQGTRNPHLLESYRAILKDEQTMRWYGDFARRYRRWYDRLYKEGDASPETRRLIEEDIAEIERFGFRPWVGWTYEALANYHFRKHDDDQGLQCLEEARACNIEGNNISGLSQIMGRIGYFHLSKGDLGAAERAFLEGYDYALLGDDAYNLSRSLAFLSELRATQGHFADAESLLVRSIEYGTKLRNPLAELSRLADLAKLHESFGEYERSSVLVEQAISLADQIPIDAASMQDYLKRNSIAHYVAECLALQAKMQINEGDPTTAIATMEKARSTIKGTGDPSFEAEITKKLGDACAAAGRDGEAVQCYAQACANAHRRRERDREAEYLIATGELFLDRNDFRRAEEYLKRAAGLVKERTFWKQRIQALHLLARAKALMNENAAAKSLLDQSIALFERELAEKRFAEDRHALNECIRAIFADLLVLQSEHGSVCDSLAFTAEKARHLRYGEKGIRRQDLDACIARCIRDRGWIPENALVVQHLVTSASVIIIAMDRSGASFASVPISRGKLDGEIEAFVDACASTIETESAADSSAASREIEARGRSLYDILIAPIDSLVSRKEVLCFISDEPLRRLPFGALIPSGDGVRFLVEHKRILSSPNLLSLQSAERRTHPPRAAGSLESPLIVGQPDIGACLARNYPDLETLSYAQGEVIEIRSLLGKATILAGSSATKEAVLKGLPKADCIHIVTHRVTYPAYSGKSALLLSTSDDCDVSHAVEASLVTEGEIEKLDLSRAKLVVLSACESAAGENRAASGGFGLAGAFLEAGAHAVVATIWPIEDLAARQFVTAFYRDMIMGGCSPGEALNAVQNRIIRNNRSNGNAAMNMQLWAPFLLAGDF